MSKPEKFRILVVDHRDSEIQAARRMLKIRGVSIRIRKNARAAIDLIPVWNPHMVLTSNLLYGGVAPDEHHTDHRAKILALHGPHVVIRAVQNEVPFVALFSDSGPEQDKDAYLKRSLDRMHLGEAWGYRIMATRYLIAATSAGKKQWRGPYNLLKEHALWNFKRGKHR